MRATTINTSRLRADEQRTNPVRVMWMALATLGFLVVTQAPLQGQQYATAIGANARGVVRTTAHSTIPAILILREAAPDAQQETWQGTGYTEHLLRYTVAANVQWELAASQVPAGVEILTATGEWVRTATGAALEHGIRGNATEALVRVRVPDGTPATWAQDLQLELRRR